MTAPSLAAAIREAEAALAEWREWTRRAALGISVTAAKAHRLANALDSLLAALPAEGDNGHHAQVYAETVAQRLNRVRYACARDESDLAAEIIDILDGPGLAALPAEGESAHREERVQTKIDAAVADLGNVIYNIETGEIREAMEQAREIRESLATIAEEKP